MCFIRTVSWFSAHDRKENEESWELTSCTVPEKVTITFETSRGFVRTTSTKYNYSNKKLPICMAYHLNYFKDNFQGPGCKSCKMCSTDNFALRLSALCKLVTSLHTHKILFSLSYVPFRNIPCGSAQSDYSKSTVSVATLLTLLMIWT